MSVEQGAHAPNDPTDVPNLSLTTPMTANFKTVNSSQGRKNLVLLLLVLLAYVRRVLYFVVQKCRIKKNSTTLSIL